MNKAWKHFRIAIAAVVYGIARKLDCSDIYDIEAELRRLDPSYLRSGEQTVQIKNKL